MDPDRKRTYVRFDTLTPLGKAVWLAGAVVNVGNRLVRHVVRVASDSRQAFREGLTEGDVDPPPTAAR